MTSKVSYIVVLGLLAAGCRAPSLSSVESRETEFDSKPLTENARANDGTDGKGQLSPGKNSHSLVSSQHDAGSGENTAIAAPAPARHDNESVPPAEAKTDVEALVARAQNDFHQGRLDLAKINYQRVLVTDADHPVARQGLGNIADLEQNFPLALEHYQAALRRKPNDPDLLSDLGYSYLLQGKFGSCEDALSHALRLRPDHQRALNNLGLLCAARGDYDGALAAFRKTAGETGAQARMAQLFPQGRPVASPRAPEPQRDPPAQTVMSAAEPQIHIQPRTKFGESPQSGAVLGSQAISLPLDSQGINSRAASSEPTGPQAIVQTAAEIDISNEPNGGTPGTESPPAQRVIPSTAAEVAVPDRQFGASAVREPDRRSVDLPYWPPRRNSESVEQPLRQGIIDVSSAQPQRSERLNNSRVPVPASDPAEDLDPVAAYEAEIKRRSRPAYSVERSFRTGTGMRAPVRETANRDPYDPAR